LNHNINKYYSYPPVVAVELFSSGWCNLECKYCYIPKTDFLKKVHKAIIERIKDGSLADDIIEIYGDAIESISHWGTEPTLTLAHFKPFYEKIEKACPKLKDITISSNFMTNPHNLVKWITEILPQNKSLNVDVQVSLDGPPGITDKNRIGGSTAKIIENCIAFTKELNRVGTKHKVFAHLKPTSGDDDILYLSDMNKTTEYYEFFDNFITDWVESNYKNVINISLLCDPTLVLPGEYNSDDGKAFYQLVLNQVELQKRDWKTINPPESNYYWRYKEKSSFYRELFTKQKMFTCSAGDSCVGAGDKKGTTHFCHQTFYMDHPEYYDEVKKYGLDQQTMEAISSGRSDIVKKHFITTKENELQTIKLMYLTRGYNDFLEGKISTTIAQALALADCGQISPIYKNIKMAEQLAYFAQVVECPINNVLITSSQLVGCSSLLRVFGNGAFENIFGRIIKERR
jgi:sulfatase maturation enzyme AslB (radical SAM superfamily)